MMFSRTVFLRFEGATRQGAKLVSVAWNMASRARDAMFQATDTNFAPWRVAPSNRKKTVRLNIINDILKSIPYKELPREKLKLPARQKPGGYVEPNYPYKVIPQAY